MIEIDEKVPDVAPRMLADVGQLAEPGRREVVAWPSVSATMTRPIVARIAAAMVV